MAVPRVQGQNMSHTECHDPRCKGLLTTWYVSLDSDNMIQTYLQRETVLGVSPGFVKWQLDENGLLTLSIDREHTDLIIMDNNPVCIQVAVIDGYYHVEMRKSKN